MKNIIFNSIFLAVIILAFAACGETEDTQQTTTAEEGEQETATQDETQDDTRTIEIIGTDDMRFAVAESQDGLQTGGETGQFIILEAIEASPGEEIQINLRTVSNLPASAMSHNFVLLEPEANTEEFARSSIAARENDFIDPDLEDQVIANTSMLGDGETDSITFTVPEEPGEYDFLCTFPGHYSGGMTGTLIVQ